MTEENEKLDEVLQDEAQLEELVEDATAQVNEETEEGLQEHAPEVVEELTPEQQIAELKRKAESQEIKTESIDKIHSHFC